MIERRVARNEIVRRSITTGVLIFGTTVRGHAHRGTLWAAAGPLLRRSLEEEEARLRDDDDDYNPVAARKDDRECGGGGGGGEVGREITPNVAMFCPEDLVSSCV